MGKTVSMCHLHVFEVETQSHQPVRRLHYQEHSNPIRQ